jgi:hypothetical protein
MSLKVLIWPFFRPVFVPFFPYHLPLFYSQEALTLSFIYTISHLFIQISHFIENYSLTRIIYHQNSCSDNRCPPAMLRGVLLIGPEPFMISLRPSYALLKVTHRPIYISSYVSYKAKPKALNGVIFNQPHWALIFHLCFQPWEIISDWNYKIQCEKLNKV